MDETIEQNALMQERYLSGLYDGIITVTFIRFLLFLS